MPHARAETFLVTWASTQMQVTCTLRDAGFITEMQKRDTTETLCTDIASLRASVQLRALRVRSTRSSCTALARVDVAPH
jgi:hypothetical protein